MVDPRRLPIYTHTHVLGADIGVWQQADHEWMEHGRRRMTNGIDVVAVGDRPYITKRERRYIAAWARRNLFDGAKADVDEPSRPEEG